MKKYLLWEVLLSIQNVLYSPEESVEAYPHKTISADEYISLIYRRLSDLSMRIDSVLGQKTGPRRSVPVLAEKNVFILTASTGIVRAGRFYVFLDAGQPAERLNRTLDTLQVDLMIADKEDLSLAGLVSLSGEILPLEDLISLPDDALNPGLPVSICRQSTDTDLLYDIFTSDPTGVSKGVVASYCSAIDFIGHFTDLFHIAQDDIIGNQAPFDFDVSVKDIYSAFKTGATLEVIPKKLPSIPIGLLDYLCDRKITMAIWAVSALCIITTLRGFTYCVPSHLDKIPFSGEAMSVKHLNTWRNRLPKALLVNLYGPTEITCNCTYYVVDREFEPGASIPIGRPLPNETVSLLDENNRLTTEPGQNGKLCVAGTVLVLSYYRGPRRTAIAFVQNPLNSCYPETIYRTGDLACYGRDGFLHFNGRKDLQIKHMGHRIEPGEIEVTLETMEGADRTVCLFLEEKNKIAAFYEGIIVKRDIAIDLESLLPYYMSPNLYRNLTELPRTGNDKVDRQTLRRLYG